MAIDYQKILMDMNRPHDRQGNAMKKLFGIVCFVMVVGGGAYAAWETGIAARAWHGTQSLLARFTGRELAPAGNQPVAGLIAQTAPGSGVNPPASVQPAVLAANPGKTTRPATSLRSPTVSSALPIPAEKQAVPLPGNAVSGGQNLPPAQGVNPPLRPGAPAGLPAAVQPAGLMPMVPAASRPGETGPAPYANVQTAPAANLPRGENDPYASHASLPVAMIGSSVSEQQTHRGSTLAQAQAQLQAQAVAQQQRQLQQQQQMQQQPQVLMQQPTSMQPQRMETQQVRQQPAPQPQSYSQPAPSLRPAAQPAQPGQPSSGATMNMAPTPVLSDAKAQIKVVDQMLAQNPAEALRRIEELMVTRLEPDDAAEAGYRRGYAARMLRDEAKAETSWRETAEKFPNLRGGRFSALALADTWFHRYAGDRPQLSYWDDIQLLYSRAIGSDDAPFLPDNVKTAIKTKLNRLNDALFFGSAPSKLARYHKVEQGELLGNIASKYRVDYESISRINGINPNRIHAGMDLKVVVGEVDILVRKNERNPNKGPTVTWFLDGRWVREYPACVGDGNKTPAGTYQLTSRERNPSWTNPANGQLLPNDHPENILGSRWMAMKGMNTQGLGIHGTTVYDSIPGYTSAGCVRLLNKDVEELFSYARIGGRVTILD